MTTGNSSPPRTAIRTLEGLPASRSDRRRAGNLPEETSRLIGRRAESAEVRGLLGSSRLVTLTGPGGVGKTRLALEVARRARVGFTDGVWVTALDELTQPDLLPAVVLAVMGSAGRSGTRVDDLVEFLGDRRVLLVLDNCEHMAHECASLAAELLGRCPHVSVLATSQTPLGVRGESRFAVPPLSLPEPGQYPKPSVAATVYEAVALFVDRAESASPGTGVRLADEEKVIDLCRQLDGLPLAIELAAAGTRHFPIDVLLRQVQERLQVPTSGSRAAPERQRSLRASLDHSYEFCSTSARELWGSMSVFRGGADFDAVEQVCRSEGLPQDQLHAALAELVDRSVVTFDGIRYRMLETIRRYGLLVLGDAAQSVRLAHRDHYLELAISLEEGWFGPEQPALIERVASEQANLRAALEFCLESPEEVGAGLRLASALWAHWVSRGLPGEGRRWLDRLLAADQLSGPERVGALWVNAVVTAVDGDVSRSLALAQEGCDLALRFEDRPGLAHAVMARGFAEVVAGQIDDGISDLQEAVTLQRQLSEPSPHLATALGELGSALCHAQNPAHAAPILEEARALSEAGDEQLLLSWALTHLGLAALLDGRPHDAAIVLRDALARKRSIQDHLGMNVAVELLSWAALDQGDADRAAQLLGASEAMPEPLVPHLVNYQRMLGWHSEYVARARERVGPAAFESSFEIGRRMSPDEAVSYALVEQDPTVRDVTDPLARWPLTPREREVALLVAQGRTNRQIAAQLVIAHRTADTHVENILKKLGFTSRTQVATLFERVDDGRDEASRPRRPYSGL